MTSETHSSEAVTTLDRVLSAISTALQVDPSTLDRETSMESLEAWDSLGHLNIVLQVEEACGVQFDQERIPELTSVQELVDALSHLG